MNLLLLLSALLSALSGVGVTARPVEARQAVAQGTTVRVAVLPTRAGMLRPQQVLASLIETAHAAALSRPLLASVALWMGRRRE